MPRRATTQETDASMSAEPKVKAEKKVKTEKMRSTRPVAIVEEEQDEEQEHEDQGTQSQDHEQDEHLQSRSSRSAKRRRINEEGGSVPSPRPANDDDGETPEEDGEDDEENEQDPPLPRVKTMERDADGYIPGSIVRIQLRHFVTYDYVEFFPGPFLNMILGPNGTGKSSIACAIALGLNFHPNVLGRATQVGKFVKNGHPDAHIEIELKGPPGKGNLVIRRQFQVATKNGGTWTLNGKSVTGFDIKRKVAALNVQVSNLCTFLPQDKVTEFARMSSQQLLVETERAAGDENLTTWHKLLIEEGAALKALQEQIKRDEEEKAHAQARNANVAEQVQRFKERVQIQAQIDLLELLIPVTEYAEARPIYHDLKLQQRRAHERVTKCKDRNKPVHERLKTMERDMKNREIEREKCKKSTAEISKRLAAKGKEGAKLEAEMEKVLDSLSNIRENDRAHKRHIAQAKEAIASCEADLNRPPPSDLMSNEELDAQQKQLNMEGVKLKNEREELNAQIERVVRKQAEQGVAREHAEKKIADLGDPDVRKLGMMKAWDSDTHDAIVWVRQNRHLFRMEVFETPFMRVSIRNSEYTNAVEACFNSNQLRTFVAQCKEDVDLLNRRINDDNVLGNDRRRVRINTWYRDISAIPPPPMNPDELHALGFDGYALDYIDCPEGLRKYLEAELNLHRTAIALDPRGVDIQRAMNAVGRPISGANGRVFPGGASFICGTSMNTVSRSRYGRQAVSNMTREISKARNLVVPNIDPEMLSNLQREVGEATEAYNVLESERQELQRKQDEVTATTNELQKRLNALRIEFNRTKAEHQRRLTSKSKLEAERKRLKDLRAQPSVEDQTRQLRARLSGLATQRLGLAREINVLVQNIIAQYSKLTMAGLSAAQVAADERELRALVARKDEKLNQAMEAFNTVDQLFLSAKARCTEILERSRALYNDANPDVQAKFTEVEQRRLAYEDALKAARENGGPEPSPEGVELRSAEDLQAERETLKVQLEMNQSTDAAVVKQYEDRIKKIEELEEKIAKSTKAASKKEKTIKETQNKWHPALVSLVASIGQRFSAAFEAIGCAGEVRINENEDYAKWAIDILVKFREGEKLQLLTAHRQSGGERSLTTIMYLMSLTEEARAPFSLVDEINQGMDARAERVVHDSMVRVTCKEDSTQYFLITPKLLTDLEYHPRMKILCVNNGEWLPEEQKSGNMMAMIDLYLQTRNGARAASSA